MIDMARFKPKTVYVIYIAATPEKIWAALTTPEFTTAYFLGAAIEIEPKEGGAFVMRKPDGTIDVSGEVVEWSPPRRLASMPIKALSVVDWPAPLRPISATTSPRATVSSTS